jgi:hypothetical protein
MRQATKLNTGKDEDERQNTALPYVFEAGVYSITSTFCNFYNHVAAKNLFLHLASSHMVNIDSSITSCPKHRVTETYLITSWFLKGQ